MLALESAKAVKRILVVDGDLADSWRFREIFEQYGGDEFQVIHEFSLVGALKRLSQDGADLVLLDINLPEGRGLANLVRILLSNPKTPVVILTGLKDEKVALQALRCGAEDYVIKGEVAERETLIRICRYSIARHRYYVKGRY